MRTPRKDLRFESDQGYLWIMGFEEQSCPFLFYCDFFFICLFLESVYMCEWGKGRERGRQQNLSRLQAVSCQHSQTPGLGSNPGTVRS